MKKENIGRKANINIEPVFINRVSPRSFTGDEVTLLQVEKLMEAARWAPSAFNEQPWKYLFGLKNTTHWNLYLSFLVEANMKWAQDTGVLFVILSKKTFSKNNSDNPTNQFDAGASWMSLALQAEVMGLAAHAMLGFDANKARVELNIPEEYEVIAMVAVGVPVEQEKYQNVSIRKSFNEIAVEGKWS